MPWDAAQWKQWEGKDIASVYPLRRYIGGTGDAAVFETEFENNPAAIKVVAGTREEAEARLGNWKESAELAHPALVKSLASGLTASGESTIAYLVMELAEENLAAVLVERPLTPDEVREMLPVLLDVLAFLHGKGFAHGHLRPPNLMALGDQLKVSSDSLIPGGDPAVDTRSLGPLIKEVLGSSRSAEPFGRIVKNADSWNLDQIGACLRGEPIQELVAPRPSKSRGFLLAIGAGIVVACGLALFLPSTEPPPMKAPSEEPKPAPPPEPLKPQPKNAKAAKETKTARENPMGPLSPGAKTKAPTLQATSEGVTQVLPDIPEAARNTITGRVRINVRVRVDNAGNVTQATAEPPLASKYFVDRVVAASRSWKFPAGSGSQEWFLRFELMRDQTRAFSSKVSN